jgi:DNA-binding transcriptional LysR family regulator
MRDVLPEIQIELVSSNIVSNLLRREADIAVRMVQPEQGTLIAKKLGSVSVGVYAHKSYVAKHGTPQHPDDLLNHALIGIDADDTMVRDFAQFGQTINKEAFALRSDDLMVQWQALVAGCGVGFVADYMGRHQPDLVKLMPRLVIPPLPMWLAVHREIRSSQRIRAVFDYLAKELPKVI